MFRHKKILGFLLTLLMIENSLCAMFSVKKEVKSMMEIPFLNTNSTIESPTDQLTTILEVMKKKSDETSKGLTKSLNKVNKDIKDIADLQPRLNAAQDPEFEYLNKKGLLLNARKQTLMSHQELLGQVTELLEQHISLLKAQADYKQESKQKPRPFYSWNDFREAQAKCAENQAKIDLEKGKKEKIAKQILSEKESLASLEKQLDVKGKLALADGGPKGVAKKATLKQIADIFEQEINLLNEKIELSKLKIDKLGFEEKYKNDEINGLQIKLDDERDFLVQIERRLLIDIADVELAKAEWNNEAQKALVLKDGLNAIRESKSFEKERLTLDLDFMRGKIKQLKAGEEHDTVADALSRSILQKLTIQHWILDKELQIIDAKKDIADVLTKIKELQYASIDARYRLKNEQVSEHAFDDLLENFKNQRDLEISNFKGFKEKQHEAVLSLIENKRIVEEIKLKIEKFKTSKIVMFKGKDATLETILGNYEEALQGLAQLTQKTQDFFAISSELIGNQEAVLKYYAWIIDDFVSRKIMQGIWQRSASAISLNNFLISLSEADFAGRRFFWETPVHFAPSALWQAIKHVTMSKVLFLFLFLFLFIIGYLSMRLGLALLGAKFAMIKDPGLVIKSFWLLILFIQEHFSLVYSLAFLYVYMPLRWFATPYYITLFHLLSIPVLFYLSNALIDKLKAFNKESRYVLVSEKFQDRFIILISLFFYSTVTIIPLRFAFLAYSVGQRVIFGDVLVAAYSLLLLFICLFFFTKEDVLNIIPTHTNFLIWLKRKIDKYYYPVFFFVMGLLILSSHSIGYCNLAWYLAFAVPATIALLYALFFVHNYIRKYSIFIFMQEDEDEIRDKFEHAKTYYGFFVIATFLLLVFVTVIILARIWELDFTPADFWQILSEKWVIPMTSGYKFGFVQFMILVFFVVGGFLVSSLVHKFMFSKLFDILRTEPGLQNTVSRISHYMLIGLAFLFGLVTIHIDSSIILAIGTLLLVGAGLALKDVLTDFLGGFLMLLERPIEIGNYVEIEDRKGTVHKISARTTTIVNSLNHSIVIPNREFLSKVLTNWGHGRFAVGFEIDVRVRHDSDQEAVKRVLGSVVQGNPIVLRVPAVVVRLEAFEENALYFLVRAFISSRRVKDQWEIAAQMRMEILKAFREHDIKLAVPSLINADNPGAIPDDALTVKFKKEEK